LEFYEGLIKAAAAFPPDFTSIDKPAAMRPVPAEVPDRIRPMSDATVVLTGHTPNEWRAELVAGGQP
jgi:hypothetical protein